MLLAAALSAGALGGALIAAPAAKAAIGGGSAGGGGVGAGASNYLLLTYDDISYPDPPQGWGTDSIEAFKSMLQNNPTYQPMQDLDATSHFDTYIRSACNTALSDASARGGGAQARVVQIGVTVYPGGANGSWVAAWGGNTAEFTSWYQGIADAQNAANLYGWDATGRDLVKNAFLSNIPASNPRAVCVAVNEGEVIRDYALNVSTDKGATFGTAGSQNAVNDVIHTDPGTSTIRENVSATVNLHWDGPEGQSVYRSKAVTLPNSGDTRSPEFRPADFGWNSWPAGGFWFDVLVGKQGRMQSAVDTPDRDPRESWTAAALAPVKTLTHGGTGTPLGSSEVLASGMFYDARIVAHSNGYGSSMTIKDAISTDKVFIGATDKDVASAAYVLDPNGTKVGSAVINIDRSTAGKVTVSGTVANIGNQGLYTLVVPTYVQPTTADYTIADDSQVCYTASQSAGCVSGNSQQTRKVTPAPNKVWVLDEAGALTAVDPTGSNNVGADNKTFAPGTPVSAVVNGSVPANLAEDLATYVITDNWTNAATYVDFTNPATAKVFYNGNDVTAQFDIKNVGTTTVATAKAAFLAGTGSLPSKGSVKLVISGVFKSDYTAKTAVKLTNAGAEQWNNEAVNTNVPAIYTATPTPDKAWILDENGALSATDPNWTNTAGADNKVFLPGDAVSAVVNGHIPANLAAPLTTYVITDDWTGASSYVDFTNAAKAKVYLAAQDVTAQFDIKIVGTTTVATARASFLATTAGLGSDQRVMLIISGNFKSDYDTNGATVRLTNGGSETWNNKTVATNQPSVFTWTPDPAKQVNGSADESGDKIHDSIEGLTVFPNQKLEYSIQLDVNLPQNTALGVKTLSMEDTYDTQFTPDRSSVEFWDMRTAKPIARSAYVLRFDDANHSFTADFTPEWIAANVVAAGANTQWKTGGWLTVRFTGTVKADTAGGSTVRNQAFQIINGVKTGTNIPEVKIPSITPDKESLDTNLDNIDGKTVVQGDHIMYRLTLDGGPARDKLAYNVHKLGMVDDYDEGYLDLSAEAIRVTNKASGADVTDKFNIQVRNGQAYVFAKQVDSTNAYGELLKGDPQPADLAAYDSAVIVPHTTPIIDQALLGQQYWITLDAVVSREVNDYTIVNQARQNIQNTVQMTKIVSNPLKDIDPGKDVVVDESSKDTSLDGKDVKLFSTFNYRLNSSLIPADRAYKASSWSLADGFDTVHDSFTGIWAIYANADLYEGAQLIFKKGALLADSAGHQSVPYDGLFDVTFDEGTYKLDVTATQKYLDMVNTRGDLAQGFSVYTKMERIAPGDAIVNKTVETYNATGRDSNTVTTRTTESPAIDVESYTLSEALAKGDRDDVKEALDLTDEQLKSGTPLGFRVRNTGDVALAKVSFSVATAAGTVGTVADVVCEVPLDEQTVAALNNGSEAKARSTTWAAAADLAALAIGQSVDCKGTLQGMTAGTQHSDAVTVAGESVFTAKRVSDRDTWHAKAAAPVVPQKLAVTGTAVSSTTPALIGSGVTAILAALAAAGYLMLQRRREAAPVRR
jgi:adhesin isopeptide-forming family sspB-C2 type protein